MIVENLYNEKKLEIDPLQNTTYKISNELLTMQKNVEDQLDLDDNYNIQKDLSKANNESLLEEVSTTDYNSSGKESLLIQKESISNESSKGSNSIFNVYLILLFLLL
jgi:hypothetical protein